jgi:hypothetical protein
MARAMVRGHSFWEAYELNPFEIEAYFYQEIASHLTVAEKDEISSAVSRSIAK